MNIRPTISVPLPWLTMLAGRFSGRKGGARRRHFFKMPRSLVITREGKWFIAIQIFIGVAAINTGNNLLYLVLATLLSVIIISGLMSESTLRGVHAKRRLPLIVFKDAPAIVRLDVTNSKRYLPSFSFNIKDDETDEINAAPAYVLKLGASEHTELTRRYTFKRRGLHTLSFIKVYTRYPFGLFIKGREEPCREEILVYPSVKLKKKRVYETPGGTKSSAIKSIRGSGGDLHTIRDYTRNDDSRFIHWKSAGRTTRLQVKEFQRETGKKVFVIFDNLDPANDALFEDAVDEAASVINHYILKGYCVGLKTVGKDYPALAGVAHLHALLRALALIKPAAVKGAPIVRTETWH